MNHTIHEVTKTSPDFELFRPHTQALDEFEKHGEAKFWKLEANGRVIGKLMASVDKTLRVPAGYIGAIECSVHVEEFQILLNAAMLFLKSSGCKTVVGPVDLSIYRNYRIQTLGENYFAHPGEPRSLQYFESLFLAAGFKSLHHWKSWDFDKKICELFYLAMAKEASLYEAQMQPYEFQRYNVNDYDRQCRDLYELVVDGFYPNFGGSRPTLSEFVTLFSPTKHVICTDASRLVYERSSQKLVGMSYACQVPGQPDAIVFHSFAIHPDHRKSGIGQKIFAVALEETLKKYTHIVGALAKEGRTAYDKMGPHTREYHVYEKEI